MQIIARHVLVVMGEGKSAQLGSSGVAEQCTGQSFVHQLPCDDAERCRGLRARHVPLKTSVNSVEASRRECTPRARNSALLDTVPAASTDRGAMRVTLRCPGAACMGRNLDVDADPFAGLDLNAYPTAGLDLGPDAVGGRIRLWTRVGLRILPGSRM